MKQILCAILIVITAGLSAQNFRWAKAMGGTGYYNQGQSVTVDKFGNVYSIGFFHDTADFDPGPATFSLVASRNNQLFISKMDTAGNFIWAKQLAGIHYVIGNYNPATITADSLGNIYITSIFDSIVDVDPGSGSLSFTCSPGGADIFIEKLSPQGNLIWARQLGGPGYDFCSGIALDNTGNVYTTGFYSGLCDFDPGPLLYNLPLPIGLTNCFISKLSNTGNFVYALSFSQGGGSEGHDIQVDNAGNIYVCGSFWGSTDFDPGTAIYNLPHINGSDIFVVKLNSAHNLLWARNISGSRDEWAWGIALDPLGNVFTTGYFSGTIDLDPGPGISPVTTGSNSSAVFVSKLNSSGNFVWGKSMVGPGDAGAFDIAVDAAGNSYLTGNFCCNTIDFDPGIASYTLSPDSGCAFLEKLDPNGNFIWSLQFGGLGASGSGMYLTPYGDQYVTGTFYPLTTPPLVIDFNPGPSIYSLSGPGFRDAYVLRLSPPCVPPAPPVVFNPVTPKTCVGKTLQLQAYANGAITWYTSASATLPVNSGTLLIVPSTLTPGSYTYYLASTGCIISLSKSAVSLTVFALPQVIANANPASICSGEQATVTASGAFTYTWANSGFGNTIIVQPGLPYTYTVLGTDLNSCVNSATASLAVSPCISLPAIQQIPKILMYPTPAKNEINISCALCDPTFVEIYNANGVFIKKIKIDNWPAVINIGELPFGLLSLRFETYSGYIATKILHVN